MILEKLNWMDQALTLLEKISEFPNVNQSHLEKRIGIYSLLKMDTSQLEFLEKDCLLIAIQGFIIVIEIDVVIPLSISLVDFNKWVEKGLMGVALNHYML